MDLGQPKKGIDPYPCPTCLAILTPFCSSSSRVLYDLYKQENRNEVISFLPLPRTLSSTRKISGKKKCGISFVKEESFPLEIVSHFLIPSLGFISWHCDRQSCRERGEYYICLPRRKPCDCRTEIPFISFHPV